MTLYAQYIKSRENFECIEEAYGFVTFRVEGEYMYLRDMYIIPNERQNGYGSFLADRVADEGKKRGCKKLVTTVSLNDPNADLNKQIVGLYGFEYKEIKKVDDQLCIFEKEL